MSKRVTILVPVFNEEDVLEEFYARLCGVLEAEHDFNFEIMFVDDGSSDNTGKILRALAQNDPRVTYISLSRNFGKERALLAGVDAVDTDALIVIDADLQDPPELIPTMLEAWSEGYDDVYAKRRSRAGETWLKRSTASAYYKLLQSVTNIPIQKDTGDFRLLDRKAIDALKELRESERNTKALFSWIGYRKRVVEYDRDPRAAGKTKFNYRRLTNLALDGVTSFTTTPLRIATFAGGIVSTAAFIYLLVIVIRAATMGSDVAGYPSMMAVMLFLGGVQLLCLGVIGEYVGRIFNETKDRPAYLVAEFHKGQPGKADSASK